MSIDFDVGVLRTFLASMKAKVHLYQKYVSVFPCLHAKTDTFLHFSKYPFSKYPIWLLDTEVCQIRWESTLNSIGYV